MPRPCQVPGTTEVFPEAEGGTSLEVSPPGKSPFTCKAIAGSLACCLGLTSGTAVQRKVGAVWTASAFLGARGIAEMIRIKVIVSAIAREEARISKFQSERLRERLARDCRRCLLGGYSDTFNSLSDTRSQFYCLAVEVVIGEE